MIFISVTPYWLGFINSSEKNGLGHGRTQGLSSHIDLCGKWMYFSEPGVMLECNMIYSSRERQYLCRYLYEIWPPLYLHLPLKIILIYLFTIFCLLLCKELGVININYSGFIWKRNSRFSSLCTVKVQPPGS